MITKKVLLGQLAYARSGDKGTNSNIGVIAYSAEGYKLLAERLTTDNVAVFFQHLGLRGVKRYELANLWALNFILEGALAGGGSRSLRIDAQGKALGQAILEMVVDVPEDFILGAM